MACDLTGGFEIGCRESVGGIKNFYLANKRSDLSLTTDSSGIVTAMSGTNLAFYKYNPRKETSSWTEEVMADDQAGTVFYMQTAQIILTKMEQRKRNEIVLLAKANMLVIAENQEGRYFLLGETNGVTLANSPGGSGTAYADRNGYELNFEGKEPTAAREVQFAAFSSLVQAETGES